MKQLFKILLAVSVIAFAVSMTAGSCGKTPDAGGNNNNNSSGGGNSGGDGNGGGTPTPKPPCTGFCPVNFDADLAKVSQETNILLKLSAWPDAAPIFWASHFRDITVSLAAAGRDRKAFEFVNDKATEGMVLVGKGNIANAGELTTEGVRFIPDTVASDEGIHVTAAGNVGVYLSGLNFLSIFANKTTPTDSAVGTEPFAFSAPAAGSGAAAQRQPLFFCRAVVPGITTAGAVAATSRLAGGHKAECFVSTRGAALGGAANAAVRTAWFAAPAPFKREIQVAVAAIKTDGKTIGDLMPGADAAAKLANFNDGISTTEMAGLITASGHGTPTFRKFNIKIVSDADFAAAP